MMLVGRLGDSLFAMPAPRGHDSTGIAAAHIVDYPINIEGRLGEEVRCARKRCPFACHPVLSQYQSCHSPKLNRSSEGKLSPHARAR